MNTLNFSDSYTNTNYPLTIEGLKLLQDAIALAAKAVYTGVPNDDNCYILYGCTESTDGIVAGGLLVIAGELFTFDGDVVKQDYLKIIETDETITVSEVNYNNARSIRSLTFTPTKETNAYPWADFTRINNNVDLYTLITTNVNNNFPSATNYLVPKGAIVMWSGAITAIPSGWALCDGYYYNPSSNTDKSKSATDTCTTLTPNLSGKFIAGYSADSDDYDSIGNIGGEDTTKEVIGHVHSYVSDDDTMNAGHKCQFMKNRYIYNDLSGMENSIEGRSGFLGDFQSKPTADGNRLYFYSSSLPIKMDKNHNFLDSNNNITDEDDISTSTSTATGSDNTFQENQSLDNRPCYYVLAYIMKL